MGHKSFWGGDEKVNRKKNPVKKKPREKKRIIIGSKNNSIIFN